MKKTENTTQQETEKMSDEQIFAENSDSQNKNAEEQTEEAEAEAEEKSEAEQLLEAKAELEQMHDKYLRLVAEFDNFRKRTIREKAELILNGGEKVMLALLPVLDDLQRAQQNMEKSDDVATLKEGVDLIIDKLNKTLASQGLKSVEAVGEEFNTDFHEAIAMVPVEDGSQKGKVIDCVQTGYMLNEKVIRHAKVAVGQ